MHRGAERYPMRISRFEEEGIVLRKIIALAISLVIGYIWFMGCHNAALRDSIFSYMTTYADLGMFLVMESVSVAIGQLIVELVEANLRRGRT